MKSFVLLLLVQLISAPSFAGPDRFGLLPWVIMAMQLLRDTGLDIRATRSRSSTREVIEELPIIPIPGDNNNCFFTAIRNAGVINFSRESVIQLLTEQAGSSRFRDAVLISALNELLSNTREELTDFLRATTTENQILLSRFFHQAQRDMTTAITSLNAAEQTALYSLFIDRLQAGAPMPFERDEQDGREDVISLLGQHFGFNLRIISANPRVTLRNYRPTTHPLQTITLLWTPGDIGHFDLVADPEFQSNAVGFAQTGRYQRLFSGSILGTNSGQYRLGQLIAKGSHATVHEVRNQEDSLLAAKLTHPNSKRGVQTYNWAEAALVQSVCHPGVMPIHDVFYGPLGSCLMIMPKALGTLHRSGNYSLNSITTYMIQLLAALNAIHRAGILHRDLKAANILITSQNTVAITDFGLAARISGNLTQERVGTPYYIAPEVIHGRVQTPAVDLWSLGVILYELTFRIRPFIAEPGENTDTFLRRIFPSHNQAANIIRPQGATVEHGLWSIISGLLEPRLAYRLTIEQTIRNPYLNTRRDWLIERIGNNPEWARAIVQFYEDFLGVPRSIEKQNGSEDDD